MVRQYQTTAFLDARQMEGAARMRRKRRWHTFIYQASDFGSALVAWVVFFLYRKTMEGAPVDFNNTFLDPKLWYGAAIIPLLWIIVYSIFDKYRDIYRISRIATLSRTFFISFIGVLCLFFGLLLIECFYRLCEFF